MRRHLQAIVDSVRQSTGFRRHANNTAWLMAEQACRLVAGLLVGAWMARFMGPEKYGIYTYVTVFMVMFSSVAKLGLDELVVRSLVMTPDRAASVLGTVFWLRLASSLGMLAVVSLCALAMLGWQSQTAYALMVGLGLMLQAFEVIDLYFQSHVQSKPVALSRMAQLMLSSALKVMLVLLQADLIWFVAVLAVDQLVLAMALCSVFRRFGGPQFFRRFNLAEARLLLGHGWPWMVSALVMVLYTRIDQLVIAQMMGAREMGLYAAAVKLSEVAYLIPMVLVSSVFPTLVDTRKRDEVLYLSRLKKLYALLIWSGFCIAVLTTLCSKYVMHFLYGAAFDEASGVLAVHIWTCVFVSIGIPFGKHLVIQNQNTKWLIRTSAGVLVNLGALWLLIPLWGLYGAAWSAVFSYALVYWFADLFDPSMRSQWRLKAQAFFKPFASP